MLLVNSDMWSFDSTEQFLLICRNFTCTCAQGLSGSVPVMNRCLDIQWGMHMAERDKVCMWGGGEGYA